jgi:hypothetical protein
MAALLTYVLNLDTRCDFAASFTFGQALNELTSFVGATAEMMIRESPADPNPLLTLSTTASPSGQIYLGVAPPGPFGVTLADIAAMIAYDASALTAGTLVYVETPVSYYAWAPGSLLVPDGVSIIDGVAGQWLLSATIRFAINSAALLALVGTVTAAWDLVVTWSDGTKTKFIEGRVLVDQTNTYD